MKRLVVVLLVVALAVAVLCLGATESLINRSGKTASGVVLTFSESVRITSHDESIFPTQEPSGRAMAFTFSEGSLANGARFRVSWSPNSAEIVSTQWVSTSVGLTRDQSSAPMGLTATTDTPTVGGNILSPAYFAHAAYVIQGVSDRGKVFALPLRGVPELAFLPTAPGIDLASVTWSCVVSHPEGIGSEIAGDTLYIWGNNAAWAGYGQVTLTATAGAASGSVTIPVTLFRADKTLVNAEGKKDYFVPWSPQLDINRILSVEEHMRKYSKDEGFLDRSIQWSRWKRMPQLNDVTVYGAWCNELVSKGNWHWSSQRILVDVQLREFAQLGVGTVRVINNYYIGTLEGNAVGPVYDQWNAGPTKRPDELEYLVNEAHRLGLRILLSNSVAVNSASTGGVFFEIWQANPSYSEALWGSYATLTRQSMELWCHLGADIASLGYSMEYVGPGTLANRSLTDTKLALLAGQSRASYPGPMAYLSGIISQFKPGESLLDAHFWDAVDIMGVGIFPGHPLTTKLAYGKADLVSGWAGMIAETLQPFQSRRNKPLIATEDTAYSIAGMAPWGAYAYSHIQGDTVTVDVGEMRLYYQAQIEAFSTFEGYFGPGWEWYAVTPNAFSGGPDDPGSSPRDKVNDILQLQFTGHATDPILQADGNTDDWEPAWRIIQDGAESSLGPGEDILTVWGHETEDSYFVRIDFSGHPTAGFTVQIASAASPGRVKYELKCWTYGGIEFWGARIVEPTWRGTLYKVGGVGESGVADVVVKGATAEIRLYKDFVADVSRPIQVRAIAHKEAFSGQTDLTEWASLPAGQEQ